MKTGIIKADRVIFSTGDMPAQDVNIAFHPAGFVVIAKDEDDDSPVWYNRDIVERIEGVRLIQTQAGKVGWI